MHKMPALTKVQFRHTHIPCSDDTWIKHRNAARLAKDILGSLSKVEGDFFKMFSLNFVQKKANLKNSPARNKLRRGQADHR